MRVTSASGTVREPRGHSSTHPDASWALVVSFQLCGSRAKPTISTGRVTSAPPPTRILPPSTRIPPWLVVTPIERHASLPSVNYPGVWKTVTRLLRCFLPPRTSRSWWLRQTHTPTSFDGTGLCRRCWYAGGRPCAGWESTRKHCATTRLHRSSSPTTRRCWGMCNA